VPESWRRLNGAGQSRTGASSVPAWRHSPTGPVTVVLVADGSMWLVRWLQNFIVQLQSGCVEPVECQSLQIAAESDRKTQETVVLKRYFHCLGLEGYWSRSWWSLSRSWHSLPWSYQWPVLYITDNRRQKFSMYNAHTRWTKICNWLCVSLAANIDN